MDRKIGWGVVVAVALEAMAALVWAGSAAERLTDVEQRLRDQRSVTERLARLEAEMTGARRQLDRIEERVSGK